MPEDTQETKLPQKESTWESILKKIDDLRKQNPPLTIENDGVKGTRVVEGKFTNKDGVDTDSVLEVDVDATRIGYKSKGREIFYQVVEPNQLNENKPKLDVIQRDNPDQDYKTVKINLLNRAKKEREFHNMLSTFRPKDNS